MIRITFMRIVQVLDFLKTNDLADFLKLIILWNRKAIIIVRNLDELNNTWEKLQESSQITFEEINSDTFFNKKYQFPLRNRYHKALHYLDKGFCGHAAVKGGKVIGEVWYSATKKNGELSVNPDVKKFRITAAEGYAYSFDQFVVPAERGNSLAAALVNYQLCSLKEKGYRKVFGFYWADNIPAIWNNKVMNKYKEIKTVRVYGCWLFKIILDNDV